jgi:hypothetical protein
MLTNPSTSQPVTSIENRFLGEYFAPSSSRIDGDLQVYWMCRTSDGVEDGCLFGHQLALLVASSVWGDKSVSNFLAHPPVNDDNQRAQCGASLAHSMTRSSGISVATMVDIGGLLLPPSAASTLPDPTGETDPQLQSMPYDVKEEYPYS